MCFELELVLKCGNKFELIKINELKSLEFISFQISIGDKLIFDHGFKTEFPAASNIINYTSLTHEFIMPGKTSTTNWFNGKVSR